MERKSLVLALCLWILPLFLGSNEGEMLRRNDIQKVMKQIFEQHVDKKEISGEILKNSFKVFIDQFDPEKVYLLQSEVEPFIQISPDQVANLERQYRSGDFSFYEKLNLVIQKAISRARSIRSQLEKNPKELLELAQNSNLSSPDDSHFAANEGELRERIKYHLVSYLNNEIKRYGDKAVVGYEAQALALYERNVRNLEDQYLYRQDNGEQMGEGEQENLFTLHVLKSLAKSLDAHTAFFDSQEAYDMRVRLEKGFEGVGLVFQQTPRGITVSHIVTGSPAAKNGQIKIGDLVVKVNGTEVGTLPFEKVMELMRGEKEAPIELVFKRMNNNQEYAVSLKKETILMNDDRVDVDYEQFGNGIIGRITLHSFYQNDKGITSEKDVREAIRKLDQEGNLRGLILDLRENSGGFLSQAVKVAGLFITNGIVVISEYSNGDEKIYRDMDSRVLYDGPLIVLTSRATASAAEIVAQALQDYGVALIVGDEQTYGKGTIQSQTVTDKKGSSFFKVTVGKYYTVSGKTPQLSGVKADVIVPGPYAKAHMGEEFLERTIHTEDTIPPEFADPLKDIDPSIRPWYLKYYMPTLQQKLPIWRDLLPQLQKNSSYRLANNKNYKLFLKRVSPNDSSPDDEEAPSNFGTDDVQLNEAINIVKDMIYLQGKSRHREYTVGVP